MELWYYEKNGNMKKSNNTMKRTMVLYRKLWNFALLSKNYGTIVNYSKL